MFPRNKSPLSSCRIDHAPKHCPDALSMYNAIRVAALDEEWIDEDFVEAFKGKLAQIRIKDSKHGLLASRPLR